MMISTKGRYALRILTDIAEHQGDGCVPLKESADRQEISEKYLESIVSTLVKCDFIEGLRGKGGGYRLSRPAEEIVAYDVLSAMEGMGQNVAGIQRLQDLRHSFANFLVSIGINQRDLRGILGHYKPETLALVRNNMFESKMGA